VSTEPEIIERNADDNGARTEVMVGPVRTPQAVLDASEAASWTPRMVITVDDAVAMIDERDEFMKRVLAKVKDGIINIPGSSKPALGKPGAERLLTAYGLHPEGEDETLPIIDLTGADHGGEPFIQFRRRCTIWRQTGPREGDRMRVASLSGECNSWETKYRYRESKRVCPSCKAETIIQGKKEYGGGWVCFKKQGGCGAKFADDDTRITEQTVGRVLNPDIADQLNTILKMAEKRALVAATIAATSWSDVVTQDLDDQDAPPPEPPPQASVERAPTAPTGPVVMIGDRPRTEVVDEVLALFDAAQKQGDTLGRLAWGVLSEAGRKKGSGSVLRWMQSLNAETLLKLREQLYPLAHPTDDSGGDVDPNDIPFAIPPSAHERSVMRAAAWAAQQ